MIKLILSILLPVLFISNYWVCEYLFPGFDTDWGVFIEMDKMSHNIWSLIMLIALVCSLMKTKYQISNLFLLFTINLSTVDVMARVYRVYEFNQLQYVLAVLLSAGFAILFYYKTKEK